MKTVWEKYEGEQLNALYAFNEDYRKFLSLAKTERELTRESE